MVWRRIISHLTQSGHSSLVDTLSQTKAMQRAAEKAHDLIDAAKSTSKFYYKNYEHSNEMQEY